jgi:hypothetical protein
LAESRVTRPEEDPRRTQAALRQRYVGTAVIGFLILLYGLGRIFVAWWGG